MTHNCLHNFRIVDDGFLVIGLDGNSEFHFVLKLMSAAPASVAVESRHYRLASRFGFRTPDDGSFICWREVVPMGIVETSNQELAESGSRAKRLGWTKGVASSGVEYFVE